MMHHHTKCGCIRFSGSEDIFRTKVWHTDNMLPIYPLPPSPPVSLLFQFQHCIDNSALKDQLCSAKKQSHTQTRALRTEMHCYVDIIIMFVWHINTFIERRRIASIPQCFTTDATKTIISAFIWSKLDYCNFLLAGSPQCLLDKLQKVQNSSARLVLKALNRDHIQPLLRKLHWLPVRSRIEYKMSSLCYNSFTDSSPDYLSELLTAYTPSRQPRSSADSRTLRIPSSRAWSDYHQHPVPVTRHP